MTRESGFRSEAAGYSSRNDGTKGISGILPIVCAVFDDQGRVDLDGFHALVKHLVATGANGLTLFGLATEFYKLGDEEKDAMMSVFLSETTAAPDVAGIVSVTDHSWEVAIQRARKAELAGAEAIMLLPPYFLSPSMEAVLTHAREVVRAVSIPVIVQYAPSQTGVRIAPETFVRLQEEVGKSILVKVEAQPPGRYASLLHELSDNEIRTLIGYAGVQMPDVLERGSVGIQPGCSFTEVYVALYRLFQQEDKTEAHALFRRLLPYISYWMQGVELIIKAEKVVLERRGIISSSYCRRPDYRLDSREEFMIEQFLEEFWPYLERSN